MGKTGARYRMTRAVRRSGNGKAEYRDRKRSRNDEKNREEEEEEEEDCEFEDGFIRSCALLRTSSPRCCCGRSFAYSGGRIRLVGDADDADDFPGMTVLLPVGAVNIAPILSN